MTRDKTAKSGSDYTGFKRLITFRDGQSYVDVTVKTAADSINEEREYFMAYLEGYYRDDRVSSGAFGYINDKNNSTNITITDQALSGLVNKYLIDKRFTKNELTSILETASKSGISSAELKDLKSISSNLVNFLSETDKGYLSYIFSSTVNGNNANKYYTGGTSSSRSLGNLKAGSTEEHVSKLISKWFLGKDRPSNMVGGDSARGYGGKYYAYSEMTGPLFKAGVDFRDIAQGQAGTCYLLSAAACAAKTNTQLISSMFRDNNDGTYGVRFYANSGKQIWVTVDRSSLVSNGYAALASNSTRSLKGEMWVTLLEKAYAQANEIGEFGRKTAQNSYTSIENGLNEAIKHISGKSSSYIYAKNMSAVSWNNSKERIISKINNNEQIFVGCFGNTYDSYGRRMLVANHAFSIVGYDKSKDQFTVRNPWGSGSSRYIGEFKVNWSQLHSVKAFIAYT